MAKNFKIGQEVVYIKRSIPECGLVKNKTYIIQDLQMCGCSQNVDIGLKHNMTSCQCPTCCETICYDQRWFLHEEAFEPLISDCSSEGSDKAILIDFIKWSYHADPEYAERIYNKYIAAMKNKVEANVPTEPKPLYKDWNKDQLTYHIICQDKEYDRLKAENEQLKAKTIWQYDQLRTYAGQVDLREIDIKQLQDENQKLREVFGNCICSVEQYGSLGDSDLEKYKEVLKAKNV